jgi:hypothetical protein
LKRELERLSVEKRLLNTKEGLEHIAMRGRNTVELVVGQGVSARIGIPVTHPGYEA